MPDDAPPPLPYPSVLVADVLRAVEALHADVRRLLESRERPAQPEPVDLSLLLRAIAGALGGREFCVRDLYRHPDVALLLNGRSAKAVGKLLTNAIGRQHGAYRLTDYCDGGRTRAGRLYAVERAA